MSTNTTTLAAERVSGRHPVNVGHLVMGIAFLAMVGVWALIQGEVVDHDDIRWLMPVPWVLAGLAGLLAIAVTSGKRWSTQQVGWIEPAPDAPEPTDDEPIPNTEDPGDTEAFQTPEENR